MMLLSQYYFLLRPLVCAAFLVVLLSSGTVGSPEPESAPGGHYTCSHKAFSAPLNQLPTTNTRTAATTSSAALVASAHRARGATSLEEHAGTTSSHRGIKFHIIFKDDSTCSSIGQTARTSTGSSSSVCDGADILAEEKRDVLVGVLKRATEFISSALLVKEPTKSIDIPADTCGGLGNEAATVEDVDFVLFVTATPDSDAGYDTTLASAKPCVREGGDVSTGNLRPVIGYINFRPSALASEVTELAVSVVAHEISHALGFIALASSLNSYVDLSGAFQKTGGSAFVYRPHLQKNVTVIQTPRVVAAARTHFGCPTLDGVEIEGAGGSGTAGSHWKKRIFYMEALVGVISTARLFYSSVTLAAFEDMGFYVANYAMAQDNYPWGYQRGCDFLYRDCRYLHDTLGVGEFCFRKDSPNTQRCTFDRMSIGYCDAVTYNSDLPPQYRYFSNPKMGGSMPTMDYCPTTVSYSNVNCVDKPGENSPLANMFGSEFGPTSQCFDSNTISSAFPQLSRGARCFHSTCITVGRNASDGSGGSSSSSTQQLLLRIQGQTAPCSASGAAGDADTSLLRGVHGSVSCPAAAAMCQAQNTSGLSDLPSAGALHSPLEFTTEGSASLSCAMRAHRCQAAELSAMYFPHCGMLASRLLECYGNGCLAEMRMALARDVRHLRHQCGKKRAGVAETCLDGWEGANVLCTLAAAAAPPLHLGLLLCVLLVLVSFG